MTGMEVNKVEVITPQQSGQLEAKAPEQQSAALPLVNKDNGTSPSGPNTTPPNSAKFNYKNFPCNSRDVAMRIVSDTLSDVDRAVRNQTQENPYVVDYDTFPNPKDYDLDGMSKNEQYNAWKDDVTNWKNRQLEEIERRNHATVDNLNKNVNQLRETVIDGFLHTFALLELSQVEMLNIYNAFNGNLEQMKAELQTQMQELQKGVDKATRAANYAARVAKVQGEKTRELIHEEDETTRRVVKPEKNLGETDIKSNPTIIAVPGGLGNFFRKTK